MIIASNGQRVDMRAAVPEWGPSTPPLPGTGGYPYGGWSWAGRLVSTKDALGLAAVAACIRLLSSQVAGMPFSVYTGSGAQREPAAGSWQHDLLANPSPDWDSFTFMEDIVSSGEAVANSFVEKVKAGGRVVELRPMDPDYVRVRIIDGRKVIEWAQSGNTTDVTNRVMHIRGWAPAPSAVGTSIIQLNRQAVGSAIALEEYQGRYFQNDARPSIVINHPAANLNKDQRRDIREGFESMQMGSPNAHRLGIMWGGATLETISSALKDTQAVELVEAKIREAGRMFGVDDHYIGSSREAIRGETPEQSFAKLWRLSLFPRCRRIERAFASDPDLFAGSDLSPLFDPTEMLRADTGTTATVIQDLVQVGVITANEGRAWMGLQKSADPKADVLQDTPVGGAPNATGDAPAANVTPGGGDE